MGWLMCFISVMVEMMKDILVADILIGIKKSYKNISICVLLGIVNSGILYVNDMYKIIIFPIMSFLVVCVFTKINWKKQIQASIIGFQLISLLDLAIWLIINATTILGKVYFFNKEMVNFFGDILGLLLWMLVLFQLRNKKNIVREYFIQAEGKEIFLIIWVVGIFSMILTSVQGLFMGELNLTMIKVAMVASVFVAILVIFICGYLVYSVVSKRHLWETNELNEKCIFYQKEYYDEMVKRNEELAAFRHDIDKHFRSIRMLVEEEKYGELKQYTNQFGDYFKQKELYKTGNLMADYIINGKIKEICEDDKTEICIVGKFPTVCLVSDFDLCIILDNALDNVKEALKEVKNQSQLDISIQNTNKKLYLRISNTSNPRNIQKLKTTKQDIEYHGYGLKNIKKIVEQYNGMIDTSYENGMFILQIVL